MLSASAIISVVTHEIEDKWKYLQPNVLQELKYSLFSFGKMTRDIFTITVHSKETTSTPSLFDPPLLSLTFR